MFLMHELRSPLVIYVIYMSQMGTCRLHRHDGLLYTSGQMFSARSVHFGPSHQFEESGIDGRDGPRSGYGEVWWLWGYDV